jgi:CheY-like chemotaxis protein
MRLLVLDDEQNRHDAFQQRCPCDELTHVFNVEEALNAVRCTRFDVATLDYDLCAVSSGLEFVTQMITLVPPDNWPARVLVHTQNPAKGLRMTERLRDAGIASQYVPFQP